MSLTILQNDKLKINCFIFPMKIPYLSILMGTICSIPGRPYFTFVCEQEWFIGYNCDNTSR